MEQPCGRAAQERDVAAQVVDSWPALRPEPKGAWHWLRAEQARRGGVIVATREDLASAWSCGGSSVDRRLRSLQSAGLLNVAPSGTGAGIEIRVVEPTIVDLPRAIPKPRRPKVVGRRDPQLSLPLPEDPVDLQVFDSDAPPVQESGTGTGSLHETGTGSARQSGTGTGFVRSSAREPVGKPHAGAHANDSNESTTPRNLPTSQRTVRFNEPNDSIGSGREPVETGTGSAREAAGHVGYAVAAALDGFCSRTQQSEQKAALEARLIAAVNDPEMHRSVAGKAADLVVFHGIPMREIERVLRDIQELRRAKAQGKGAGLRSPGRFFHAKIRELAHAYGHPEMFPNGRENQLE